MAHQVVLWAALLANWNFSLGGVGGREEAKKGGKKEREREEGKEGKREEGKEGEREEGKEGERDEKSGISLRRTNKPSLSR